MSNKGLYKTAIEWPWSKPRKPKVTPPEPAKFMYEDPPAGDMLLETPAIVQGPNWGDRSFWDPTRFMLSSPSRQHPHLRDIINVNTRTDTPYDSNTIRWQPPTNKTFNYSEFYNAQVDDPQGWAKYQEYRRNLPLEDINKVTKVPANNAKRRGTDRYSSADDFVNTVGQGPRFRWYNVPTERDAEAARRQLPWADHVPIYALSRPLSSGGSYKGSAYPTQYGHIILGEPFKRRYLDIQYKSPDTRTLRASNNYLVAADGNYMSNPQMTTAGHEMAHALTWAYRAPGTDIRWPGGESEEEQVGGDGGYSYDPVEQVQAIHTLNKSYQALLNSLAKGNHKDMPSEFRKIIEKYPAYGDRYQFTDRNRELLRYPELAVKYLGAEPSRALAQLKQLRHNAWLWQQGLYRDDPRVRDAPKHLDFFNDNYFADASFNGNATQRTV